MSSGVRVAAVVIIRPVALAGLLLAGCTVAPTGPPINVPDVGGMWAGTWGGTPVTLLVTDQRDDVPSGAGVYVGSWLLLGGQTPGLSGVMSYTARGDHVSVNVNGRFAMLEGRLALIVDSAAPDGAQQLRLKWIEPDQLVGSGTSKFSWGPQGPVELKRPPVTR